MANSTSMSDCDFNSQNGYEEYQEESAPIAVHQCNLCNKIFVNFKGLQQHAVVHTDVKPFQCEICGRAFRFKSNMFEHRSIHTGFTPHICSFCGKSFRLKGNMKKHMRTHVTTKEELEAAYRPYSSNRRPNSVIPDDAIVIRGPLSVPFYGANKIRAARKLQLGPNATKWIGMLARNELLPIATIAEKLIRVHDATYQNNSAQYLFTVSKGIEFEVFHCPFCKVTCCGKVACDIHILEQHQKTSEDMRKDEMFCDKCVRTFPDENMYLQHMSYHSRVSMMIRNREIENVKPSDNPSVGLDEIVYHYLEDDNNNRPTIFRNETIKPMKLEQVESMEYEQLIDQNGIVMMVTSEETVNSEICMGDIFDDSTPTTWTNPSDINLNEMILEQTSKQEPEI